MTDNQWKTLLGIAAAVVAFLLVQSDVVIPPLLKVALGAASVGLAVIDPNRSHGDA